MPKQPIIVYRVWCGRKCYGGWLPTRRDAFVRAHAHGLAYGDPDVELGLGPLTWIERGQRKYARSKTISLDGEL